MPSRTPKRFSRARRWFRRFRLLVWTGLLLVTLGFLWLNYAGLPGFIRNRILAELKEKQFDLTFAHVRLDGFNHVLVEGIAFRPPATNQVPQLFIEQAEMHLDAKKLLRGQLELLGLTVREGRVDLPVTLSTGEDTLTITNIQTNLRFLSNSWSLDKLTGQSLGADISIAASITNASLLGQDRGSTNKVAAAKWEEHLGTILDVSRQLKFATAPKITINVSGDAGNWASFSGDVRLMSRQAETPWGSLSSLEITGKVFPTNGVLQSVSTIQVRDLHSEWGRLQSGEVRGDASWSMTEQESFESRGIVRLGGVESKWGAIREAQIDLQSRQRSDGSLYETEVRLNGRPVRLFEIIGGELQLGLSLAHSIAIPSLPRLLSDWMPGRKPSLAGVRASDEVLGKWWMDLSHLSSPKLDAQTLSFRGSIKKSSGSRPLDPALGFWNFFRNYHIPWRGALTNIMAAEVQVGSIQGEGAWEVPFLISSNISARLYDGDFAGALHLDTDSRNLKLSGKADFDYHKLALLLDKPVQRWLAQFGWENPPLIQAAANLNLPSWTNSWSDWKTEVLPSLEMTGHLDGSGNFRGIPIQSVTTDFYFTNFVWTLPNLHLRRPEGEARLFYKGNITNADFYGKLNSGLNPGVIAPLMEKDQKEIFEALEFRDPPMLAGEVWGNWDSPERLGFALDLAATNFAVKGEPYSDISAFIQYTNLIFVVTNVLAHRGPEEVRAPYLRVDVTNEVMFVTNAVSSSDPYVAMKLIGPQVYNAIDPFRFAKPPLVTINGYVPLRHYSKADIHFDVVGHDFTFWRFHIPNLSGKIHWKGDDLKFRDVRASFYEGQATWEADFVFDKQNDADYSFSANVTEANLKPFISDIVEGTNQMEGTFSGELIVTSAKTKDDHSWNGYGAATMRDGFLWNVPIFGVFSPLLEAIAPGLGTSRISAGSATFTMTNTVVYSRDLEVRAPAFRLQYDGKVDLEGNLDATVEALLLRDAWVLGPVFSVALWPVSKVFEARVTGTMDAPQTRLRYVPKFLLAPLKVLNLLKQIPTNTPVLDGSSRKEPPQEDLKPRE